MSALMFGLAVPDSFARVRVLIRPWWPRAVVVAPRPRRVVVQPKPHAEEGLVKLNVLPSDAEVHVNGKYCGVAASFSGYPDYLRLGVGSHSVTLSREGFKSEHISVYATAGQLFELDIALDRLGEAESKPETTYKLDLEKTGRLTFKVEPADATVYINDQLYGAVSQFSESEAAVILRAGEHTIQVARPGYETYTASIEISADVLKEIHIGLKKSKENNQ